MISNNYVQTGLLTGKAWDTTCHWIEDYIKTLDEKSSLENSTYYGNYYTSKFKYINSSNEEVEKVINSSVKISTGSTEYTNTKNIYDLAGNIEEWTTEINSGNTSYRTYRGGHYNAYSPVLCRNTVGSSYSNGCLGFRTRLYIK